MWNTGKNVFRPHPYHHSPRQHASPSPGGLPLPPHTPLPPTTPRKRYCAPGDLPFTPSPRPFRVVGRPPHSVDHPQTHPQTPPARGRRAPATPLSAKPASRTSQGTKGLAFLDLSYKATRTIEEIRKPLPKEEQIFAQQLKNLQLNHEILHGFAKDRDALDRAEELAPSIAQAEREANLTTEEEEEEEKRRVLAEVEALRREQEKARAEKEKQAREELKAEHRKLRQQRKRADKEKQMAQQLAQEQEQEDSRRDHHAREQQEAQARREEARIQEERDNNLREERRRAEERESVAQRLAQEAAARAAEVRAREDARIAEERQQALLREKRRMAEEEYRNMQRLAQEAASHAKEARARTEEALRDAEMRSKARMAELEAQDAARARAMAEQQARVFSQQRSWLEAQLEDRARKVHEKILTAEAEAHRRIEDLRRQAEYEAYAFACGTAEARTQAGIRLASLEATISQMLSEVYDRTQAELTAHLQRCAQEQENQRRRQAHQSQSQPQPQQQQPPQQHSEQPQQHHYYNHPEPMAQDDPDVSMRDPSIYIDMDASMSSIPDDGPPTPTPSPPPPPPPLTDTQRFSIYEAKWDAFRLGQFSFLCFNELPWPILHDVDGLEDITVERILEFFTHCQRPRSMNKGNKELARAELLRWHPDKFMGKVIGKTYPDEYLMIQEAVGLVARFLIEFSAM